MVERYDLEVYSQGAAGQCDMELSPDGGYVLYSDYATLEQRFHAHLLAEGKLPCPYCGGMGWVEVDVGQLFECMPCKQTGFVQK